MIRTLPKAISLILLLVAFLGTLVGCQSAQTTAAHKIADALPHALGPADRYDVSVEGDSLALARGHAQRIHVVGQQVHVAPDTTLDMLDVDARGITFDPGAKRLQHVNQALFTAVVGQQSLDRYLAAHHPQLYGLHVRLRSSDVTMDLPISVPGASTQAILSGTLQPDEEKPDHLDFVADAASIGSLDVPVLLVNSALKLINPVFGLSPMKVPLTITRSQIVNSQVILQGTADLDDFQAS